MIKVTDNGTLPIMKATSTVLSAEVLQRDLAQRREQLSYTKPAPRLKCVGEDETGLHFMEVEVQHPCF